MYLVNENFTSSSIHQRVHSDGQCLFPSNNVARDDAQQNTSIRNICIKTRSKSNDLYHRNRFITIATLVGILLQPQYSPIGVASGFSVVKQKNICDVRRIVFGTAALSKAENPLELLDQAYEKGFRRFDLARTYGGGESERLFGDWIESRGISRDSIDIITKGGMGKDKYGSPTRPLLTHEGLKEEVEASLSALKVDIVDLYMFHRDDPRIPEATFVEWANEIVKSGKAKSWGVSNWSFERFRAAYEYAVKNNLIPPSGNSPQFSLAIPKCEVWPTTHSISDTKYLEQIDWYDNNNIELLCWEVLAKGFMAKSDLWPKEEVDSSTFFTAVEEGTDEWRIQRIQRAYCHDENYRRRDVAIELARNCGCNLSQVAAMYPLSMGKHISVIFGSNKAHHLDDMIDLEHLHLDSEAMFRLTGVRRNSLHKKEQEKSVEDVNSLRPILGANNVRKFSRKKGLYPFGISGIDIKGSKETEMTESRKF